MLLSHGGSDFSREHVDRRALSAVYPLQVSLGEMVAYLPIPGGHIKLAERFVDPAFSFVMVCLLHRFFIG